MTFGKKQQQKTVAVSFLPHIMSKQPQSSFDSGQMNSKCLDFHLKMLLQVIWFHFFLPPLLGRYIVALPCCIINLRRHCFWWFFWSRYWIKMCIQTCAVKRFVHETSSPRGARTLFIPAWFDHWSVRHGGIHELLCCCLCLVAVHVFLSGASSSHVDSSLENEPPHPPAVVWGFFHY